MYGKATGRHSSGAAGVCVPTVADAYKHQTVSSVVTFKESPWNSAQLIANIYYIPCTHSGGEHVVTLKPKTNLQLFRGESLQLPPSNEMVEIKIAKFIMNMNYATITVCGCCNFAKFSIFAFSLSKATSQQFRNFALLEVYNFRKPPHNCKFNESMFVLCACISMRACVCVCLHQANLRRRFHVVNVLICVLIPLVHKLEPKHK